jgi:hypothetical protein
MENTPQNGQPDSSASTKRAIIYCRVSTDEQAEKGTAYQRKLKRAENMPKITGVKLWRGVTSTRKPKNFLANLTRIHCQYFVMQTISAVPCRWKPDQRDAKHIPCSNRVRRIALLPFRSTVITRPPEDGDEWDMPLLIRGLAKLGKEIHTVNRGEL